MEDIKLPMKRGSMDDIGDEEVSCLGVWSFTVCCFRQALLFEDCSVVTI